MWQRFQLGRRHGNEGAVTLPCVTEGWVLARPMRIVQGEKGGLVGWAKIGSVSARSVGVPKRKAFNRREPHLNVAPSFSAFRGCSPSPKASRSPDVRIAALGARGNVQQAGPADFSSPHCSPPTGRRGALRSQSASSGAVPPESLNFGPS
ncbi:hypothetical protein NDU88_004571 [Pleurodeles waltl]|uniref:Uncharacterized protein n=1 Tax=Pleurodeles waltl TaxID=8319 RepID=A0AAV7TA40_PLEWA|nr:hypothetical protein NDU88_004571 [Pleurodeles waltl]